jgi:hypothetical protein
MAMGMAGPFEDILQKEVYVNSKLMSAMGIKGLFAE